MYFMRGTTFFFGRPGLRDKKSDPGPAFVRMESEETSATTYGTRSFGKEMPFHLEKSEAFFRSTTTAATKRSVLWKIK